MTFLLQSQETELVPAGSRSGPRSNRQAGCRRLDSGCVDTFTASDRRLQHIEPPKAAEEKSMHIIGWILFGLVVGIVAKFLMPGRDPGGFILTAILGIVGALVGGFVGRLIGWYGEGDPVGFVMAVIGSIILLAVYRVTLGRNAHA